MLPNSGITTTMVGNEIGLSTHALSKLVLTAKTGGSNNGTFNLAFWTKDHYKEGTSGIGVMIKGGEPFFNVFAQKSPVVWEDFGGELRPRLRNSGNSTTQNYSFSLGDFRNYDHSEVKAELDMPSSLTSSDTTINRNILYTFPLWLSDKLPAATAQSCWVLTVVPPDAPGYNFDFVAVLPGVSTGGGEAFQFNAVLKGMPQYKDESIDLHLYVSVWEYIGNGDPRFDKNYKNYRFLYKSVDIGKSYHTVTKVTGTKDRPAETIPMFININLSSAGKVDHGYYTRINSSTIEYNLYNLLLINDCYLVVDDLNREVDMIPMGYYPVYRNTINFPGTNFDRFTIRSIRT